MTARLPVFKKWHGDGHRAGEYVTARWLFAGAGMGLSSGKHMRCAGQYGRCAVGVKEGRYMKKSIHILIKPASSECNMRCKYCFYMDVSSRRKNTSFGIMSGETVSALVRQTLAYAGGGPVAYAFQGGEPLIAGESFFHSFSETVDAYNTLCSHVFYFDNVCI